MNSKIRIRKIPSIVAAACLLIVAIVNVDILINSYIYFGFSLAAFMAGSFIASKMVGLKIREIQIFTMPHVLEYCAEEYIVKVGAVPFHGTILFRPRAGNDCVDAPSPLDQITSPKRLLVALFGPLFAFVGCALCIGPSAALICIARTFSEIAKIIISPWSYGGGVVDGVIAFLLSPLTIVNVGQTMAVITAMNLAPFPSSLSETLLMEPLRVYRRSIYMKIRLRYNVIITAVYTLVIMAAITSYVYKSVAAIVAGV
jgi:hypothetical protein